MSLNAWHAQSVQQWGFNLLNPNQDMDLPDYFLRCTNVDCSWEKTFFSSIKPEHCRSFDINKRIIYAMRRIGVGLARIKTFLALMDLPSPMSHSAYDKLSNKIHKAVKDVAVKL